MSPRVVVRFPLLRTAAVAFMLGAAALAASAAERAFFSGPSIARIGTEQVFAGGNFKPNLPVTIMVRSPGGQEAGFSAVTGSDGSLTHAVATDRKGLYVVRVLNTAGQQIVRAQFHVAE